MPSTLPDKLYYKIGEVAEVVGVRTSVLRFWESEFSFLKPVKSSSGQRLYSKNDVDLLIQVRSLLYDEKFTIEGVKKRINTKGIPVRSDDILALENPDTDCNLILKAVRSELKILRDSL